MKRRKFMTTVGGTAAAAAAAGAFSILKYPRGAHAAGWGTFPVDRQDALLEAVGASPAQSILELHINGGMNAFDTFYTVPGWGREVDPNTGGYRYMWMMSDEAGNPNVGGRVTPDETLQFNLDCRPAGLDMTRSLQVEDAQGEEIHLGPWTWPFWDRPDVLARMRVVVQAHSQIAHEAANPVSFTGTTLGQPRMAGLGAAIQRYFTENPEAPGGGGVRSAPYSYVLYPAGYSPFNAVAATTVGFHPGSSRPLVVSVDPSSELSTLLSRGAIDDPAAFDRAVSFYRESYAARMRRLDRGSTVRSPRHDDFEFASFARSHAPDLTEILEQELFSRIAPPTPEVADNLCGEASTSVNDMPNMQARMAASLLTRPSDAARYVLWIDAGLEPIVFGGFDYHQRAVANSARNLPHTFQALLDIIATPEQVASGEAAAQGLIDLDQTMIVINTEFGRTPYVQFGPGNGSATNHHPSGYVNVFIGGPIQQTSVYGNVQYASGRSENFAGPAENRMMALQAMGIYPFSSQSFAVADARGVEDELQAALRVRDDLLGLG